MTEKERDEYKKRLKDLKKQWYIQKTEFLDGEKPYESLANAIIIQTIKDYVAGSIPHEYFEQLLYSKWFELLTSVDPSLLLKEAIRRRKAFKEYEFLREEYYERRKKDRRNPKH